MKSTDLLKQQHLFFFLFLKLCVQRRISEFELNAGKFLYNTSDELISMDFVEYRKSSIVSYCNGVVVVGE